MKQIVMGLSLCGMAASAMAESTTVFDARSVGMGGTGVASARFASAALFNPALLAAQDGSDKFGMILPSIGVSATDAGSVHNDVKNLQDGSFSNTENDFNSFRNTPTSATATAMSGDLMQLNAGLAQISDKSLDFQAGLVPLSVAFPGKKFAVGIYSNVSVDVAARFEYAKSDSALLTEYANFMGKAAPYIDNANSGDKSAQANLALLANDPQYSDIFSGAGCVAAKQSTGSSTSGAVAACVKDPNNSVQSSIQAIGAAIGEVGIALAHEYDGVAVGVTPKFLNVKTFYYSKVLQNNTSFSVSDSSKSYTAMNVDLGVAYKVPESPWKLGASVKDLIPESFDTVTDSTGIKYAVKVNPRVTVGGEGRWRFGTLTADLDLTRNQSPVPWGNASQFLSVGGEFDLWILKARAGYRQNLIDGPIKNEISAGLALGPLAVSAFTGTTQNTAGVVAQLYFNF